MNQNNSKATLKSGQEPLTTNHTKTAFIISDFWRWNASDLVSNTTRGRFAEFIVGTAAGVNFSEPRREWDNYDLDTPSGIKIEVKSSAYIQSWKQKKRTDIRFDIKLTKEYIPEKDERVGPPKRHADVYVFCLLKHQVRDTIDPLNMGQWEFYVVATKTLNIILGNQKSISLNPLGQLAEPISYGQLEGEINKNGLERKIKS